MSIIGQKQINLYVSKSALGNKAVYSSVQNLLKQINCDLNDINKVSNKYIFDEIIKNGNNIKQIYNSDYSGEVLLYIGCKKYSIGEKIFLVLYAPKSNLSSELVSKIRLKFKCIYSSIYCSSIKLVFESDFECTDSLYKEKIKISPRIITTNPSTSIKGNRNNGVQHSTNVQSTIELTSPTKKNIVESKKRIDVPQSTDTLVRGRVGLVHSSRTRKSTSFASRSAPYKKKKVQIVLPTIKSEERIIIPQLNLEKYNIAPIKGDEIEFSAFYQNDWSKGKSINIKFAMYLNSESEEMISKILKESNIKNDYISSSIFELEKNSQILVTIQSLDPQFDYFETEELVWNGKLIRCSFISQLPEDFSRSNIAFQIIVFANGIKLSKLKFVIDVNQEGEVSMKRENVEKAFVSYAHEDLIPVTLIIQGIRAAIPNVSMFFDYDSLRSGDRWEEIIPKQIMDSQELYLCWSENAKNSDWVQKELNYALDNLGIDNICAIPLDDPRDCKIPDQLKSLHFNDPLLIVRNYEMLRKFLNNIKN